MAVPRPGFTSSCRITASAYGTRSPQGYSSAMMSSPSTLVCQGLGGRNPGSSETGANGRGEELIMAEHEPSIGLSSDWLTPKPIFSGLELIFDLDPAHPGWENPHCVVPTRRIYTVDHDGLRQPWCGTLWLNPPFGGRRGQVPWLRRFFKHADGIALVAEEPKPRSLQRGVGDLAHSDVRLRGTP